MKGLSGIELLLYADSKLAEQNPPKPSCFSSRAQTRILEDSGYPIEITISPNHQMLP